MQTEIRLHCGDAAALKQVGTATVDLVVTSPPYPMIAMWDGLFAAQDPRIGEDLELERGDSAFARMHAVLDRAWAECARVLRPGGLACINIGDATRSLGGAFQLYSNHARVLSAFQRLGFAVLPDILWRKPTNGPSKFMGSGTLPVGAYVTYEHEYILILRKGPRRRFLRAAEQETRRRSAFFWEERNVWFSDIWEDIRGTGQGGVDRALRRRSAAFPLELAYRLICMFSIQEDTVLDPFAGTGTTAAAALAAGRNAVAVEQEEDLLPAMVANVRRADEWAHRRNRERLTQHLRWVEERTRSREKPKHRNRPYGFPVMTRQERDLWLPEVAGVEEGPHADTLVVQYLPRVRAEFAFDPPPSEGPGAVR